MAANRGSDVFPDVCRIEYLSAAFIYIKLAVCGVAVFLGVESVSCCKHLFCRACAERPSAERVDSAFRRCHHRRGEIRSVAKEEVYIVMTADFRRFEVYYMLAFIAYSAPCANNGRGKPDKSFRYFFRERNFVPARKMTD